MPRTAKTDTRPRGFKKSKDHDHHEWSKAAQASHKSNPTVTGYLSDE
jgi:hypothetical protein